MISTSLSFLGDKFIENNTLDRCNDLSNISPLALLNNVNVDCYSDKELHVYNSLVNKYSNDCNIYTEINEVVVEQDGIKEYYLKNPDCASWKLWEIFVNDICIKYNFSIDITKINKEECDLIIDITYNKNIGEIIYELSNSYNENFESKTSKEFFKKMYI
jgi:hypothetical protein